MYLLSIESLLRGTLRIATVLAVIFISYGGIGVVADIKAGRVLAQETAFGTLSFEHLFSSSGVLHEAGSPAESTSPYFWLVSGGRMIEVSGVGKTMVGDIPSSDPYHVRYAKIQPMVSDLGAHPQNDFRLLTKDTWENVRQEITVTVRDHHLSSSENRHDWNGIDLIARRKDDNNYYFATVRMDGKVALKKRVGGANYTLAQTSYFPGTYSAQSNPTLIPENTPLTLALEAATNADGSVTLKLFSDKGSGVQLLLQKTDAGANGAVIVGSGRAGIYSDFMDLEFDNYRLLTTGDATTSPPSTGLLGGLLYGLGSLLNLQESGSSGTSASDAWWLNSGAYFTVKDGIGRTNQGSLPSGDVWRERYATANPVDTDNGYHPQNIFRLLTKNTWKDIEQQAYFNIRTYHLSDSPLRAEHNGFLFFNRYKDGNNLYYTGLRVDGSVIVKKKLNGTYYTLGSQKVLPGTYNRSTNPNLIPTEKWIGLKSVVTDLANSSVRIRVYTDLSGTGTWTLATEVIDDGTRGAVITSRAAAGIRTDYMDVWFKDYRVREL